MADNRKTKIQLLTKITPNTGDNAISIEEIHLERGEPLFDSNTGILYIGNPSGENDNTKSTIGDWEYLTNKPEITTQDDPLGTDSPDNTDPKDYDIVIAKDKTVIYDGTQWRDLAALGHANILLSEDVYTYTPIGKAQYATDNQVTSTGNRISDTNPAKIGVKGGSLKTVFESIFGTKTDTQPTAPTVYRLFTYNPSNKMWGSSEDEVGTIVGTTSFSIDIGIRNSGSCEFGCLTTDTSVNEARIKDFTYPITSQTYTDDEEHAYLMKVKLPFTFSYDSEGNFNCDNTHLTGVEFDTEDIVFDTIDRSIIYVDADSLTVTLHFKQETMTLEIIERCSNFSASCKFGAPYCVYQGDTYELTGFQTYYGEEADETDSINSALNINYPVENQKSDTYKIAAASLKMFCGCFNSKNDFNDSPQTVRNIEGKSISDSFSINIPTGSMQVVIAIPSSKTLTQVLDQNDSNSNITKSFDCVTKKIYGANEYKGTDGLGFEYNIYYLNYATAVEEGKANIYNVTVG